MVRRLVRGFLFAIESSLTLLQLLAYPQRRSVIADEIDRIR
jgi:hypothetical protein